MKSPTISILALTLTVFAAGLSAQFVHPPSFQAISNEELEALIENLESATDDFHHDFEDAMETIGIDEFGEVERLDSQADALEEAMDEINSAFGNGGSDKEVRGLASRALMIAADLNKAMLKHDFGKEVEADWDGIRGGLNRVAEFFDLSVLDGGSN